MSLWTFTPAETFEAAHAFAWFSATDDTAELAAQARSDDALRKWRAALTYVRNWPPSFLLPAGSGGTPAASARTLTVENGLKVFIAFVDAYNRLSVTETDLFAIYVAGDPAAWPDWIHCLEECRD